MKKFTLLLVAVFVCASFSFAQVLKINQMDYDENWERIFVKELQSGEVIEMSAGRDIVFLADVINTSDITQYVNLKMEVFNYTEGIDISACWGMCLEPWNFDFAPLEVLAKETAYFNVDYFPNEVKDDVAWVTCTFSVEGYDDFVIHVKFGDASPSVKESFITKNNAYPNPAISFVNIDYALNKSYKNARISICNILGMNVYEQSLTAQEGTATVDVSDFAQGVYFYTIQVDGKSVETKKLIIRR